jgi:hypothetical protein
MFVAVRTGGGIVKVAMTCFLRFLQKLRSLLSLLCSELHKLQMVAFLNSSSPINMASEAEIIFIKTNMIAFIDLKFGKGAVKTL